MFWSESEPIGVLVAMETEKDALVNVRKN